MEDISQSIECLCHIMTTVGSKLDIDKAKVRLILLVVYFLYWYVLEALGLVS